MKFSIITCTWNSEPWLAQSIESVLSQDYPDIEYIFVDGGSTDGTLERIRALPRPYVLLENVRGGISRAMNSGIAVATGNVVAHLHSDDYYLHPQVLSRVAASFRDRQSRWVVGQIVTDRGGVHSSQVAPHSKYSYGRLAAGRFFVPHPTTFVLRAVFSEVGPFDECLKYAMDWDMWLRIGQRYAPSVIPEDLAAFREHGDSLSSGDAARKLLARREELKVRMRYARVAPIQTAVWLGRYWARTRRLRRELDSAQ